MDSSGNVYVADTDNNRIQKFSSSGVFLAKWGSSGSGDGQFNNPWGIAVDSSGNVYVADTGNNRIQKFSSSGGLFSLNGEVLAVAMVSSVIHMESLWIAAGMSMLLIIQSPHPEVQFVGRLFNQVGKFWQWRWSVHSSKGSSCG